MANEAMNLVSCYLSLFLIVSFKTLQYLCNICLYLANYFALAALLINHLKKFINKALRLASKSA